MISIGKLCKQLALVFVTPYKHSSIESIKEDEHIKNPYEKNAKCIILALGIIFINLLMLKIDIIFISSDYIRQKYDDYKRHNLVNHIEVTEFDDDINTSQFVSADLNESKNDNENESESEESNVNDDEREETDYYNNESE